MTGDYCPKILFVIKLPEMPPGVGQGLPDTDSLFGGGPEFCLTLVSVRLALLVPLCLAHPTWLTSAHPQARFTSGSSGNRVGGSKGTERILGSPP